MERETDIKALTTILLFVFRQFILYLGTSDKIITYHFP